MRVRIVELARKQKMTIFKLSKIMGVSERTLYRWNSGEMFPSKSNLESLLINLNCEMADLFVNV